MSSGKEKEKNISFYACQSEKDLLGSQIQCVISTTQEKPPQIQSLI